MQGNSEFLKYLNSLYDDGRYDWLRIRRADVDIDADSLIVEFVVPYEKYDGFTDDDRNAVLSALKEIFPDFKDVRAVFRKNYTSVEAVAYLVKTFIAENYRALVSIIGDSNTCITINDGKVSVVFRVTPATSALMEASGFNKKLKDYLDSNYTDETSVSTEFAEAVSVNQNAEEDLQTVVVDDHTIGYKLGHKICGGEIKQIPRYISHFKEPSDGVCVVGEVSAFQRRIAKQSKNVFYNFSLGDTTGIMNCCYFTRSQTSGALDVLKDGDSIIATGDLQTDDYRGGLSLRVRTVWTCTIDYSTIIKKENVKRRKPYRPITPKPVDTVGQQNLFEMDKPVPSLLKGKTYVVFDLETTGLGSDCSIIEISGIKVVDGKLTSSWTTLIDPFMHIPESSTEVHGITDADVADAPYAETVLPEFAKWAGNACLVAHNGNMFDFGVLNAQGAKYGVSFPNEHMDTLVMAARYHDRIGRNSKLNLTALCKEFGIELTNAHSAYYDALATAQLFVKLCEELDG